MHPAYSVIFFTAASGAGFGLLALLGLGAAGGLLPQDPLLGLIGLGLALGLTSAGLLSSTGHLGRPERAWRAFSQWRTSWLSREGVAAVATYLPAGLLGLGWVILGRLDGWVAVAGMAAAVCAVASVVATAMIYASLKPIPQWHNRLTLPGYLLFSLMTGLLLLNALLQGLGHGATSILVAAAAATALGWAFKLVAWSRNDARLMPATAASATGLGPGDLRTVEWPHTEANYLLKEMGFRVARKHQAKLRLLAQLGAFALPLLLLLLALPFGEAVRAVLSALAALVQLAGMLVERWLFFAEAKHTVQLYYYS